MNIYNSNTRPVQSIFDSFNEFIFSSDRHVFGKLYSKMWIYHQTKHLVGDIVECGVFKGSGMLAWLKLVDLMEPHSIKKVIGFDFFDPSFVDTLQNQNDKEKMSMVFDRCNATSESVSKETVEKQILDAGIKQNKFELVKGDISKTIQSFIDTRPGFRISILNMDLDLDEPTFDVLEHAWNRVVPGGIVIFDEYGYHVWSESNAVDRFIKKYDLKLQAFNLQCPTAYVVKE